jgi:hypothetical protein
MEMDKIIGITLNEWLREKTEKGQKRACKMFQDVQKENLKR